MSPDEYEFVIGRWFSTLTQLEDDLERTRYGNANIDEAEEALSDAYHRVCNLAADMNRYLVACPHELADLLRSYMGHVDRMDGERFEKKLAEATADQEARIQRIERGIQAEVERRVRERLYGPIPAPGCKPRRAVVL